MAIIKSNSVLMAFDYSILSQENVFEYLRFIQSINFDVKTNRINQKSIGQENNITSQFVKPEIEVNITYLQESTFSNEVLFGFDIRDVNVSKESMFHRIVNNFYNINAYILMSDLYLNDLAFQLLNDDFNSEMFSISLGNLYLKKYSFSYKIDQLPVVTSSFVSSDLKMSKLISNGNNTFSLSNWKDSSIVLDKNKINNFINGTNLYSNKNIVYHMKNLSFESDFDVLGTAGPNITSFLSGLIQEFSLDIDINRTNNYFIGSGNSPVSRNIIAPIMAKVKISGISENIVDGNLNSLFSQDRKFTMTISMGDNVGQIQFNINPNTNYYDIILDGVVIDSFSYYFDLNNFLNYSIECSVQINSSSGFNIQRKSLSYIPNVVKLYTDDLDQIVSSDGSTLVTLF